MRPCNPSMMEAHLLVCCRAGRRPRWPTSIQPLDQVLLATSEAPHPLAECPWLLVEALLSLSWEPAQRRQSQQRWRQRLLCSRTVETPPPSSSTNTAAAGWTVGRAPPASRRQSLSTLPTSNRAAKQVWPSPHSLRRIHQRATGKDLRQWDLHHQLSRQGHWLGGVLSIMARESVLETPMLVPQLL